MIDELYDIFCNQIIHAEGLYFTHVLTWLKAEKCPGSDNASLPSPLTSPEIKLTFLCTLYFSSQTPKSSISKTQSTNPRNACFKNNPRPCSKFHTEPLLGPSFGNTNSSHVQLPIYPQQTSLTPL